MHDVNECYCPSCGSSRLGVKQREYCYYELEAVNPLTGQVEVGAIIDDYWWLDDSNLFCKDCDEDFDAGDVVIKGTDAADALKRSIEAAPLIAQKQALFQKVALSEDDIKQLTEINRRLEELQS